MNANAQIILQPAGEPLTLTEAKLAARIDADITADDDYIANAITTARQYCESVLGQALISRTIVMTFDRFPRDSQIGGLQYASAGLWDQRVRSTEMAGHNWPDRATYRSLVCPLQNVVSIQYADLTGTLQTLDPSQYRVDYTTDPARISPAYGVIWPLILQETQTVKIQAVVGYGPLTTIAASIAAGTQTVTPASMYAIYPQNLTADPLYQGTTLAIDTGVNRELVTVTAATGSTFTAAFAKSHNAGCIVQGGIPETTRSLMKMLVSHWYANREAVAPGQYGSLPMAAESLRWCGWNGEYT